MPVENSVVSCRLHGNVLKAFTAFQTQHGFESKSDAIRALIARGLFIDEKPKGKWSESAWSAAYYNYLMQIHSSVERNLLASGRGVDQLIVRAIDETAARLGFDTVD